MTTSALDPLIYHPERLRVAATLAALPDGDALSLSRLQDMLALTSAGLATHLRELRHAGYVQANRTGDGPAHTTAALTRDGRAALDRYTAALRHLSQVGSQDHRPPAPGMRAGDADRDAAAAALGEHYAQGRLTLDELDTRLDAALTATTHGQLSEATQDLPDLTVPPARVSSPGRKRARSGHKPAQLPGAGAPK